MKVVFLGLSYFTSKFVSDLKKFDTKNQYVFYDTYTSKKEQLKYLFNLINADIVISFNGISDYSGTLNMALRFKKKLILQWQGTDVLSIEKNKRNGAFTNKYIEKATHFTDASWLQKELKTKNINSQILHFKHIDNFGNQNDSFKNISVLSYLGKGRELFYGLNHLISLAKDYPNIIFNIVGTDCINQEIPDNIKCHGWVSKNEIKKLMAKNPIIIRLTDHDGYALSVLEAIANGNYVIWNYPHPQVYYTNPKTDLKPVFDETIKNIKQLKFKKNSKNIEWAKKNLNKEKILSNFIQTITKIAKK